MKKLLSVLLVTALVLAALPLTALPTLAATSGDFTYEVISETDKTCEITDYTGSATALTIPSELDGYTVTSIGRSAFSGCTALTSASIGNGVREIGDYAFKDCTSLTDLTVGYNVVRIGYSAFYPTALKTVKGYVGSYAEHDFGKTYNQVGHKVDFIPLGLCPLVFAYKWNEDTGDVAVNGIWGTEKHVTVPETLEGLPVTSISGVRNSYLETLVLPSTLQTIGDCAFGDWVGDIRCPKLKSVTVPNGVVSIGNEAFARCPLTSITLPESVQSIGARAFYECSALSEIHLPHNLTHIGEWAFCGTAYYNTAENWEGTYNDYGYFKQGGLYIDKYLLDFGYGGETYKIREGTVLIADGTFNNPPSNLVFPESIHTIGRGLFSGSGNCTISGITFLAADIDINWYAFDTVTLGEIRAYAGSDAQTYAEFKEIPFVDISEIKPNADGTGGTMAPRYGTAASDVAHTLETVLEDVESITVLDKNGTEIKNMETLCTPDMQFAVTFANGKTAIYVFASQTSGDVNGDDKINAVDARWVLQAASGVRTFDAVQTAAADVNGDGKVNAVDARWILQVASGARTL